MLKSSAGSVIRLRGVRHNNLKNFDLDLPLKQLIVITGLSGSGKSSLAFDTLFAEGQRRYIETFSPYARQFFDRMDKPQVDSIEGIPPAIAVEQRNAVRTTRSTVGTMTEICDYMKMLWPQVAQLHCRQCDRPVRKDSPESIWKTLRVPPTRAQVNAANPDAWPEPPEMLVSFDLPLSDKLTVPESLALIRKQGYQRLLWNGQVVSITDGASSLSGLQPSLTALTVVQDRIRLTDANRSRFIEACEQAYHFGKGKLAVHEFRPGAGTARSFRFSNRLHCAECDIEYREASPALFSFNNPLGACPSCRGFGRMITIDYNRALPDRSKTLAGGVVKPWQIGHGLESQKDLLRVCRHFEIPTDVPFDKLPRKWQQFVIEGDPDYGKDEEHEWPRCWYGVKGYFRWLESKAYKMHIRVLLSRYRAYTTCPDCGGQRFQPDALLYRMSPGGGDSSSSPKPDNGDPAPEVQAGPRSLTLADFYRFSIREAFRWIQGYARERRGQPQDPVELVLNEVRSRLGYLDEVGLGYLTLDRPTRSLSGGETERVNLTTCLGTCLVNTLFVLDEPSVGLHPRDTKRLVGVLQQLRRAGNTVVVVEHEAEVIRAADHIVDLGPGHGASGGAVVFEGTFKKILRARQSITGRYLSGSERIETGMRRPVLLNWEHSSAAARMNRQDLLLHDSRAGMEAPGSVPWLDLRHASKHNLKNFAAKIPLRRLVCVTGVSGCGKTTLVREILWPALLSKLESTPPQCKPSDRLSSEEESDNGASDSRADSATLDGWESLRRVILVDQSILSKTPRSNPAVYIGAFDDIRDLYAQSEPARKQGLNASAFSFNSSQGQCQRCRGAGFEKIEMQFLSDVFIRCPDCQGRRYRRHILEVRIRPPGEPGQRPARSAPHQPARRSTARVQNSFSRPVSIGDLLEATVEEAILFLSAFAGSRPGRAATQKLRLLEEVGLGYLKLGQPLNTLSGGESQRLKLVRHLADAHADAAKSSIDAGSSPGIHRAAMPGPSLSQCPTLFLFDEPTTGLHFDDVRVLLRVFQRLIEAGHSVLVIEHNLDVIKSADWVLDLGPEAGDEGGQIVAEGTPEQIAACQSSHTGAALRELLPARSRPAQKQPA